jgi:hypothetical protein
MRWTGAPASGQALEAQAQNAKARKKKKLRAAPGEDGSATAISTNGGARNAWRKRSNNVPRRSPTTAKRPQRIVAELGMAKLRAPSTATKQRVMDDFRFNRFNVFAGGARMLHPISYDAT